jgi:hypothetical protein
MAGALVVIGPQKSASTYICSALAATLGMPREQPEDHCILHHQIKAKEMHDCAARDAVIYLHSRATDYNLGVLHSCGIRRFVLLVRDPRDTVVSWFHHRERYNAPWQVAMGAAAGVHTLGYAGLDRRGKLDELIEHGFPKFQGWLRLWAEVVDRDSRFDIKVQRYEDFVADPVAALAEILTFFGRTERPQLPAVASRELGAGENFMFRRGVAGAHRDELEADQVAALERAVDRELFQRFGWQP